MRLNRLAAVVAGACVLFAFLLPSHAHALTLVPDAYEPDDTTQTAKPISPGETQSRIGDSSRDWVRIDAIENHSYELVLNVTQHDYYENFELRVEDANGAFIGYANASSYWPGRIRWVAPKTGPVYLSVSMNWIRGDSRTYTLSLTDYPHGQVSGRALDMTTKEPLPGMRVDLSEHASNSGTTPRFLETTTTADDGSYSFEIDWPSQYCLQFSDPSGQREGEYYGGSIDLWQVMRFDVAAGQKILSADGYLGLPWTFSGTVVDSVTSEPLPNILVTPFMRHGSGWSASALTPVVSDANGKFAFPVIARGSISLDIKDESGVRIEQWWPAPQWHLDDFFKGTPGQSLDVTVPMTAPANFEVTVIDRDTQEPITGASVDLVREKWNGDWQIVSTAVAEGDGVCRFDEVLASPAKLHVTDPSGKHHEIWYDGILNSASAALYPLAPGPNSLTVELSPDVTPPVCAAVLPDDWVKAPVIVTIEALDALDGVDKVFYRINDEAEAVYSGPFVIDDEGWTDLRYWAADRAGNIETPVEATIMIDLHGPGVRSDAAVSYTGKANIRMSGADILSGVKDLRYSLDGGATRVVTSTQATATVTAAGKHTLRLWGTDVVGNTGPSLTKTFTVTHSTTISNTLSPTSIARGSSTVMCGTLLDGTKPLVGKRLALQCSRDGRSFYGTGLSAVTDSRGKVSVRFKPPGTRYYRLQFSAGTGYKGSLGTVRKVSVR